MSANFLPSPTFSHLSAPRIASLSKRLNERLQEALNEPLGLVRLEMMQQVSRAARHAGLANIELAARMEEVWDSFQSGHTAHALGIFSWILDHFWKYENTFTDDDRYALWQQFLWAVPIAARHPQVSLQTIEQILKLLDEFALGIPQRFSILQPNSQDLYKNDESEEILRDQWIIHYQVALGLGQKAAAAGALAVAKSATLTKLPTDESSCPLHLARPLIAWEVSNSNFSNAISLASAAWRQCTDFGYTCRQPHDLDPVFMLPLAWSGQGQEAWQAHQQGYSHQLQTSQFLADLAIHLRYCLATWNLNWGIEIIAGHAQWFSSPEDPWDLLVSLRAAAVVLARAARIERHFSGEVPKLGFSLSGNNPFEPFESLKPTDSWQAAADIMSKAALSLSARYDLRNSNNTISLRTEQLLNEPPLCPLTEVEELLSLRRKRLSILESLDLPPLDASLIIDNKHANKTTLNYPYDADLCEEFDRLWLPLGKILNAVENLPEIPGIYKDLDIACLRSDQVALAARIGYFPLVLDLSNELIQNAQELPWSRLALRTACYLVQAQWVLGDLSAARQTLMLADSLAEHTVGERAQTLLDKLTFLAG